MRYFPNTPGWYRFLFPSYVWRIRTNEKKIYLTFDDGPHPTATTFVLDELKKYNAHATFFCIGKNVVEHPTIYRRILHEGHAVGNHTFNHLNGWKTNTDEYLRDITEATRHIDSSLFRPPYGRIRSKQAKRIPIAMSKQKVRVVMWSVLSCDYDERATPELCLRLTMPNIRPGSIVVFHDSAKAFDKMSFVLPRLMKAFTDKGYSFEKLE